MIYLTSYFRRFIYRKNTYLVFKYSSDSVIRHVEIGSIKPHFVLFNTFNDINPLIVDELYNTKSFDVNEIEQLYSAGNKLFIVRVDENIAVYGWVAFKARRIANKSITLKADEGFIFKCFTFLPFRRKNLYCWGLISAIEFLQKQGIHNLYIDARDSNIPSLKGINRAGFEFYKKIINCALFNIFNWTLFNDKK